MPASGVELATAYVAVTLSMRGVQKSVETGMNAATPSVEKAGRRWSSRLGSVLGAGAKVAGGAIAGILGTALVKGFNRLSAIEEAKASLSGLGHSAKDVTSIMKNALASVKGTAFGMDEAAQTAAGAVAAGIKPGKALEGVLKLVSDAATIGKTSMADMGAIFNKVATSNKIQGDVIAQLSDKGIPIVQLLAKELNVSGEEVVGLAKKGKINFETFRKAMEAGMGGAALKSGNTTKGAFKNMMAAVSRLGAGLLTGVYPLFGKVFNGAGSMIDRLEAKLTPLATALSIKMAAGLSAFGAAWKRNDGVVKGTGFIAFLEKAAFVTRSVFTEMRGGIIAFGNAWKYNDGDITSSGFPGFMERLAYISHQLWDALKQLDFSSWKNFTASLQSSGGPAGQALGGIGDAAKSAGPVLSKLAGILPSVATSVGTLLMAGLGVVNSTLKFMSDHIDVVVQLLPVVIGAFIAWKVASLAVAGAQTKMQGAQLALSPVLVLNNALRTIANTLEYRNLRLTAASTTATNAQTAATYRSATAQRIHAIATKAAGIAQRVLNFAINQNPIMKIIGLIMLLVGGLVWFFTQTKTGQKILQVVWSAIQKVVAGFVSWFQKNAMPIITTVLQKIGEFFGWLWTNAIKPAIDGISVAIGALVSWFQKTAAPIFSSVVGTVGDVFGWLYNNIIKPVFTGMQTYFKILFTVYSTIFNAIVHVITKIVAPIFIWWWKNVISPVFSSIATIVGGFYIFFRGLFQLAVAVLQKIVIPAFLQFWNGVIVPVFNGIVQVITWWWTTVSTIFTNVVNFVRTVVAAVFTWWRDTIVIPVFNGVSAYIRFWWTTVSTIFTNVVNFVRTVFSAVFTWWRDTIVVPVFNAVSNFIRFWWTTVSTIFTNVSNFIRTVLATVFTWFRDSVITPVFNSIKTIIDNVWTTGIKPIFDTLAAAIKTTMPKAFETGVSAIKTAWGKVQDIAKAPVKFVVNTVINDGIIKAFNTVAKPLGVATLPNVALPAGFYAGGWTGPGSKMQPAGIVHADEFVIRKESQQQLRRSHPGFLESLNQHGPKAMGYATGGLVDPLRSMSLTQGYNRVHKGIDLAASIGTPVYATQAGTVSWSGPGVAGPGVWGGNEIHIDGGGLQTWFAHLSSMAVKVGDIVRAGQQIGQTGNTGISSGPHLHFGVFNGGWPNDVDPTKYLSGSIKGSGGGGFNPIAALAGIAKNGLKKAFPGGGSMVDLAVGTGEKLVTDVGRWVSSRLSAVTDFAVQGVKNVANDVGMRAKWMPQITAALVRSGHGDFGLAANGESMFRRLMQESGGNPNAVNNWDSNAAAGMPSKGLMQVIDPTFQSYRDRSLSSNIFDPMANLVASINYTQSRYGSLRAGWDRSGGYSGGGLVTPLLFDGGGWLENTGKPQLIDHRRAKPDAVLTAAQWDIAEQALTTSGGGDTWNVELPPNATVNDLVDAVAFERRKARRGGRR